EVEDGLYLESRIIIDKKIRLKSKNLFGAVIDGGGGRWNFIFLVQEETEISGFILKNANSGIHQRFSRDVSWTAHDLAILNMTGSGISINDVAENIGCANLYNLIVDNCDWAIATNDAYGVDVRNCLITNCHTAFSGANHIYFNVDHVSIWNCKNLSTEPSWPTNPGATNKINIGPNINILDPLLNSAENNDFHLSLINSFTDTKNESALDPNSLQSLEGLTLNIIGDVYLRLEDYDRSAEFYRNALIIGRKISSPETSCHALYGLALHHEKQGDLPEALEQYKRAVEVIETVRGEFLSKEYKSGFLKVKIEIYESLINLLVNLHQENPSKDYNKEAFYFTEKSKARVFLDELQEAKIDLKAHLSDDFKEQENRISKEISQLQIQLRDPGLPSAKRQRLLANLVKEENKYKGLITKIKMENPDYANLVFPQPYGYEQIKQKLLDNETVLIEYLTGEKYSFAFLATSDDLYISHLSDSRTLKSLVNNYLSFLTLKETGEFKAKKGGQRLFKILIGPFTEQLEENIKKIIIVPDGNLNFLPFETLIQEKNSQYLIHDYEISYAPSASALTNILERKSPTIRNKDLLIVANPRPHQPNKFVSFLSDFLKSLSLKRDQASDNIIFEFPNLPYADKEAKAIAKFFDPDKKMLLVRETAEEKRFKKLVLSEFKILHFATHGVINNDEWWRSALIFLPDKDLLEDGSLQPREIYDLKLNSDLVVLSACQTGMGKLEKGEGVMGLVKAFLNSGSKSVIASLWNINDKSTAQFMKYFYQNIIEGKSKAEALMLAKIETINSKFSHPFHWAAFILVGDWNSAIEM
ncbi:MAG: CHAT domain-containing protein, partial [Candidatus Aminicenantes bacterium]|nr:CHAT domain-containing protein [Candidatus Aminicenantes bacterium]